MYNWNVLCKNDRNDAVLPDLSEFETYVMNEAVHSDHPTRHYIYAPEDSDFYPVLDIYVSEKSEELLQIDLNYDDHTLRDITYEMYEDSKCQKYWNGYILTIVDHFYRLWVYEPKVEQCISFCFFA